MSQKLECDKLKKAVRAYQREKGSAKLPGPAMISVASKLKSEREKKGITLRQISLDTHIGLRHLENLEEGRYGDLPGGFYNRAFLKAFCESLDLDPSEITERYEQEVSSSAAKHSRSGTQTHASGISLGVNPIMIWSLMLLISASGIFFGRKWIADIFSPYFSRSTTPGNHYEPLTTPRPIPSQASIAFSETPAPMTVVPDSEVQTPISDLPLIRLELAATEQCWILIDRDGAPAVRKLLNPGEIESLGAAEKFFVILGNAGGVHLKINGMPARQLGESGEVLRLLITEKSIPNLLEQSTG